MFDFFSFDLDEISLDQGAEVGAPEESPAAPKQEPTANPVKSLLDEVGDLTELMLSNRRKRQQESQKSRESQVAKFMALDPVARDAFEERAAILEYEAGFSREEAELRAFQLVVHAFPAT